MTEAALDAAHEGLRAAGIDFVSGLPDGWQRPLHERVEFDPDIRYVPVCNEGVGFSICAGAWLGGKKPALIMENSGLRVASEYIARISLGTGVPVTLLCSYRGDVGETEHWGIPHGMVAEPPAGRPADQVPGGSPCRGSGQVDRAGQADLRGAAPSRGRAGLRRLRVGGLRVALDRFEWLGRLAGRLPTDCLVMSTYIGAVSFEWAHHTEEHHRTAHLGQMGDVIGMAVGLALALPHRRIVCLDGDGSVLMELGQLVAMGEQKPDNLVVFVVDNGVYESIGWSSQGRRPTATAGRVDLAAIAAGCGVPYTVDVTAEDELDAEIELAFSLQRVQLHQRAHPARPLARAAPPNRRHRGQVPLRALRRAPRRHLDHRRPTPGHSPNEGQGALAPNSYESLYTSTDLAVVRGFGIGSPLARSMSRWSVTASWMRSSVSFLVSAAATQPGRSGTYAE